ncbi:MAG: flagellar type III secretion system protein FliR [Deltaproteobacteria bacterium]|nr:flagellar type III secretion system protein FliR [Deltaproteobacteria bacterium]MBW2015423.1 flagellar type III secretion system protein FliR [Deltaproteobacteria bacterium]MBW2129177.1 flagellar type III secretion system protein FliR [Deltaproteobacteria bacterium]MBW2302791.1 flagellar type III secretion system protein FliR [Deltaproteobacteria bacterium]
MPFPLESIEQIQGFFWILVRVSILVAMLPFFGAKGLPMLWKAGLSVVLAVVLIPVVPPPGPLPSTLPELVLGLISEALLGFILAFVARLVFAAIQLAGQFMAFQMGFAMARVMDPVTGVQSTTLSQFLYLFAILIFFSINGHHIFIRALAESFQMIPPNGFHADPRVWEIVIRASAKMFLVALKIAAPIIIALFLSNLCLGIVAKTVPQVNILMIGFPVNIGLGLIFFGLTIGILPPFLEAVFASMGRILFQLLRLM